MVDLPAGPATTATPGAAPDVAPGEKTGSPLAATSDMVDLPAGQATTATPGTTPAAAPGSTAQPVGTIDTVSEAETDGMIMGAGGALYDPSTPLDQVPGVQPRQGVTADDGVPDVQVNGIRTEAKDQLDQMQALADATGEEVVGIRNATGGFLADAREYAGDAFFDGLGYQSKPSQSVETVVDNQLAAGQGLNLHSHSQGGAITSNALGDVRDGLVAGGATEAQANEALGKVSVETYGAADMGYPDGPQYKHNMNRLDPVSGFLGLGNFDTPLNQVTTKPGANAEINQFTDLSTNPHSFKNYVEAVHGPPGQPAPIPEPRPEVQGPMAAPSAPIPAPRPEIPAAPAPAANGSDGSSGASTPPDNDAQTAADDAGTVAGAQSDASDAADNPQDVGSEAPAPAAPAPAPAPTKEEVAAQRAKEAGRVSSVVGDIADDMADQNKVSGNDAARYANQLESLSTELTDPGLQKAVNNLHGRFDGQKHISSENERDIAKSVNNVESKTGTDIDGDGKVAGHSLDAIMDAISKGESKGFDGWSDSARSFAEAVSDASGHADNPHENERNDAAAVAAAAAQSDFSDFADNPQDVGLSSSSSSGSSGSRSTTSNYEGGGGGGSSSHGGGSFSDGMGGTTSVGPGGGLGHI